jgi:uncharacterized alpha-E superfamily protein
MSALTAAEVDEELPSLSGTRLLARYAESILWLARYMERIENLARILDVTKTFARDEPGRQDWLAVVRINSDTERFLASHTDASAENVTDFYLLDRANPSSIVSAIGNVRENARTLRALISTEMWLQINVFYAQIRALTPADIELAELSRVCAMLKEGCQAHTGITEGTFYRDQSWCFYMIGRHLERADQTTRLLDIKFNTLLPTAREADSGVDAGQWNALLRAVAGYHAYRRIHPHGYSAEDMVGFLLRDGAFPRSVLLNLSQLDWHLSQLRQRFGLRGGIAAMERMDHVRAMLTQQTVAELLKSGLSPFLDWLQVQIGLLHGEITDAFFRV